MENANNILFWEKSQPAVPLDAQALQYILETAELGVLVLNKANEVLFSTLYIASICANNHFKTKFISIFKYETAEGSPDTLIIRSEDNGVIEIKTSFIHWNGEKAALFVAREIPVFAHDKQDEALHVAMHLTESFHLPILFFKDDILASANLRAIELLSIDSNEFHRTNFAHLFSKISGNKSSTAIENLLDAVMAQVVVRGDRSGKEMTIISRNVVLDGVIFKMVQILPVFDVKQDDAPKTTAHQVMLMASHDLREPVRTVLNYAQLTLDKLKNGKYKQAYEYAELATSTAHRMDKLLSDLKLLVSLDEKPLERINVALQPVIQAAITAMEKKHGRTFNVHCGKMPTVQGSEQMLIQLFIQLLDNAIKFKKSDAANIHIAAEPDGKEVLICVRDNGIGMPRKYKDKVFEAFQRLNRIDEYPGNGLGLAIAKKIVDLHEGSIYIESMPEMGTDVFVRLPA